MNCVRSVRASAARDRLLIVDNASRDGRLRSELADFARHDPAAELITREQNDLTRNSKVGGLYEAYRDAFSYALAGGFDYLHLIQGDMQLLWWDQDVVVKASQMFGQVLSCVNIVTCLQPLLKRHSDEFEHDRAGTPARAPSRLKWFGLTDTGLYDLQRWQQHAMQFAQSERLHGRAYLEQGFSVLCHPWPTVAPIPFPAVVRRGRQIGREVERRAPLLLEPPSSAAVGAIKSRPWTWLEEVCVPWGWQCLSPMWVTDLRGADYLAALRRHVLGCGMRDGRPRWVGIVVGDERPRRVQRRPSLLRLLLISPAEELRARLARGARQLRGRRRRRVANHFAR